MVSTDEGAILIQAQRQRGQELRIEALKIVSQLSYELGIDDVGKLVATARKVEYWISEGYLPKLIADIDDGITG